MVAGASQGIAIDAASAALPVALDYRSAAELDPSARVFAVEGGAQSEAARKAAAELTRLRSQAEAALEKLAANPQEADLASFFGLSGSLEDSVVAAVRKQDLQGPLAKAAGELRAVVRSVDELMDSRTQGDTQRAGRLMVSAWYQLVQDKAFELPPKKTEPSIKKNDAFAYAASARSEPGATERLAAEGKAYIESLNLLLKFLD